MAQPAESDRLLESEQRGGKAAPFRYCGQPMFESWVAKVDHPAPVGAASVEVRQDILAETQSTIQRLVPFLDTLRWVLIGVALIGIAVTIHARLDDWKRGQR